MDDKGWRQKMRKHMDDKGWRHKMRKPIFLRRQDRLPLMTMRHRPLVKANGALVECADVYLKVYRRRDGTGVTPRAQENINRLEELLRQLGMRLRGEPSSGVLWSKNDAYAQVFGPERTGRVRGVGLGITPSGRSATND
ncbi:hypothetical protein SO802_013489 [Lithocarpus litseifolius]|uniref:Reverse transcriptase n=1 Tax=Lithocarpus litseifolius TaxID=425828 RepID=A0AAW2D5R3_9ROSI